MRWITFLFLSACGGSLFGSTGVEPFTAKEAAIFDGCRYQWDETSREDWWDCNILDIKHALVASYTTHKAAVEIPALVHLSSQAKMTLLDSSTMEANGRKLELTSLKWSHKKPVAGVSLREAAERWTPYLVQYVFSRGSKGGRGHVYWCEMHADMVTAKSISELATRCAMTVRAIDRVVAP